MSLPPFHRATDTGLECRHICSRDDTATGTKGTPAFAHASSPPSTTPPPPPPPTAAGATDAPSHVLWVPLSASTLDVGSNIVHLRDPRPSHGLAFTLDHSLGDTRALELQPGSVHVVPAMLAGYMQAPAWSAAGDEERENGGGDAQTVVLTADLRPSSLETGRAAAAATATTCDADDDDADDADADAADDGSRKRYSSTFVKPRVEMPLSVSWQRQPSWRSHVYRFPALCKPVSCFVMGSRERDRETEKERQTERQIVSVCLSVSQSVTLSVCLSVCLCAWRV